MRMNVTAILGLLSPKQRHFVRKISHVVMDEDYSSPEEFSSENVNGSLVTQQFVKHYVKKIVTSKDKTDRRFVNMYRVRQAMRSGYNIGFKGFNFEEDAGDKDWQQADPWSSALSTSTIVDVNNRKVVPQHISDESAIGATETP